MNKKPTFFERIRYRFDNSFARGPLVLIGWLALITVMLVIVMTAVALIPVIRPDGMSVKELFWNILNQALTPNPADATLRWEYLLVMLLVTLASMFIVSILIGTLTSGIEGKIESLRKGRSHVLESGHTVILGWSSQIFTILNELMIANANKKNARIVILSEEDVVEMEDQVHDRVKKIGSTQIIFRSGNPIDLNDLEIASPHQARSIIILPPAGPDPDAEVIKTILALVNNPQRRETPYHIVTQIHDPKNLEVLKIIGKNDVIQPVLGNDIIARVIAQTSRQAGLSVVYTELLNFEGDELYLNHDPSLVGMSYRDCLLKFEDSAVIGLLRAGVAEVLNPPMDTVIQPGDQLVGWSADDDTFVCKETTAVVEDALIISGPRLIMPTAEKILVLGWNGCTGKIICELDHYVAPGSKALVIASSAYSTQINEAATQLQNQCGKLRNLQVSFQDADSADRAVIEAAKPEEYDHVIVLAYQGLEQQEADAKTLITLLHLRDIALRDQTPFSIISEMLDRRNRDLAEITRIDDFIVSDHLISLMMSQLAEDADLLPVLTDVFDPEGSEIYLKPVSEYVKMDVPVNFATLVAAAARHGETAIGYRLLSELNQPERSYGVHTNPLKSTIVTFHKGDKVIVAAAN